MKTEREKSMFILSELTRERSTCAALIELLREDNQIEVAEELSIFNQSPGFMDLSKDYYLYVTPTTAPKKELSNCYDLFAKKRGLCVIINNVETQKDLDVYDKSGNLVFKPKGMRNETKRFQSIFTQLFFEVMVLTNLSALEIKLKLTKISQERTNKRDQAFVLIVISMGENETVYGYHACEAYRKIDYGELGGEGYEVKQRDVVSIKELIAIFSEENCVNLRSKPKLHFYITCRAQRGKFQVSNVKN